MTVTSTEPSISYQYNGPGAYTFPFKVFKETDVGVQYIDDNGLSHLLILGTDYIVYLVDGVDGGAVKTIDSPTVQQISASTQNTLSIYRDLPITQEVDWVNNDPLDAETLEDSFDRIVMILQEQRDYISSVLVEAFSYKGDWAAYTYYDKFNVVTHNGDYYTAINTFTTNDTFNSANWNIVFDFSGVRNLVAQAAQSEANAKESETIARDSKTNAAVSESNAAQSEASAGISENNAANCSAASLAYAERAETAAQEAENTVSSGIRTDAIAQDYFTATDGQTTFALSEPVAADNAVAIWMNSRKLRLTEDYTISGQNIVLNAGAAAGDEIDVMNFNLSILVVP